MIDIKIPNDINDVMVQGVLNTLANVNISDNITVHFNSNGGFSTSGEKLRWIFSQFPNLTAVNEGVCQSAALSAFLGAKNKEANKGTAFMFHSSYLPAALFAQTLQGYYSQVNSTVILGSLEHWTYENIEKMTSSLVAEINGLSIGDQRLQMLLQSTTKVPPAMYQPKIQRIEFDENLALQWGVIHKIV